MVTRKKTYTKPTKIEFKGRSYRNYDKELFQDRLTGLDWEGFFEVRDPNELWGTMSRKIEEQIEELCPLKTFKVSKAREPWVTNEALEAIKDKDKLLRRARKTGKEEDWTQV